MPPLLVNKIDIRTLIAVTMGAITQVRVLGGVVGIAIAQVVLSSTIRTELPSILTPEQVSELLESAASIANLSPTQAQEVREVYGHAFNIQTRLVMYFAIASLVVCLLAFRRHPKSFADAGKRKSVLEDGEGVNDEHADDLVLVLPPQIPTRPISWVF